MLGTVAAAGYWLLMRSLPESAVGVAAGARVPTDAAGVSADAAGEAGAAAKPSAAAGVA